MHYKQWNDYKGTDGTKFSKTFSGNLWSQNHDNENYIMSCPFRAVCNVTVMSATAYTKNVLNILDTNGPLDVCSYVDACSFTFE